jgi:hypothetical protein
MLCNAMQLYLTYGVSAPTGIFIPSLVIGAVGGRLLGRLLQHVLTNRGVDLPVSDMQLQSGIQDHWSGTSLYLTTSRRKGFGALRARAMSGLRGVALLPRRQGLLAAACLRRMCPQTGRQAMSHGVCTCVPTGALLPGVPPGLVGAWSSRHAGWDHKAHTVQRADCDGEQRVGVAAEQPEFSCSSFACNQPDCSLVGATVTHSTAAQQCCLKVVHSLTSVSKYSSLAPATPLPHKTVVCIDLVLLPAVCVVLIAAAVLCP